MTRNKNLKPFLSGSKHPSWKGGISIGENKKEYQRTQRLKRVNEIRKKNKLDPLQVLPLKETKFPGLSPKERMRQMRLTVLRHYGGFPPKCACCGENEIKFLSIDHINGGGTAHRKTFTKTGKGGNISVWLLKNSLPEGFQVLCHNCNMAKGFYGSCPHKDI